MQKKKIYRCSICGNIVELLFEGGGKLVCCGKEMELMEEKDSDQGQEKHVPVIESKENLVVVKVGLVPHPMEESHYIQWIELIAGEICLRKFLSPSDKPEAEFKISTVANLQARAYCNLHGLWKSV
jgi:superoxide reductase